MYIYIQLPCGPIPATVPGMGPKTTKNIRKRHQKLSKNHQKLRPGGVPEALGGGLGTILVPKGVPGTPGDEKVPKTDFATPPRDPVGRPNLDFLSILWVFFPVVFLTVVLGGLRVQF